jgi:hypothetical protein
MLMFILLSLLSVVSCGTPGVHPIDQKSYLETKFVSSLPQLFNSITGSGVLFHCPTT